MVLAVKPVHVFCWMHGEGARERRAKVMRTTRIEGSKRCLNGFTFTQRATGLDGCFHSLRQG